MTNIFITGPTGAIGMALMRECIQQNINCYVLVRPDSLRKRIIPNADNIHIIECDISAIDDMDISAFPAIDIFYHLAWNGTTGADRNDAVMQYKNIDYTLDAVRLAQRLGCKCFVGAGSQAEYGRTSVKLSGDTPVNPEIMYGKAKLEAGIKSRELCRDLGIRHIWTRILSVYGPYDNPHSLVSSTITKLIQDSELAFTPGEQDWDFIYCDDAARALLLLGEKGTDGKVYPIGAGTTQKISNYIRILAEIYCECIGGVIGDAEKCQYIINRVEEAIGKTDYSANQVMYLCADIDELKKDTGFEIKTQFEEGIRNTIMYFFNKNVI